MQTQATTTPSRRGRPRKNPINPQFPGTVIAFSSRPRLVVGDVVELCRGCLPVNNGKLAVITGFDDDGFALIRSLWQPLASVDMETGAITLDAGPCGRAKPENLYRRASSLSPKGRNPFHGRLYGSLTHPALR